MEGLALQDVLKPAGKGVLVSAHHIAPPWRPAALLLFGRAESITLGHLETGAGFSSAAKSIASVFTSSESGGIEKLVENFWGSAELAHRCFFKCASNMF